MVFCLLACAAGMMWQFAPTASPEDRILADVAQHAARFWESATLYVGRETWRTTIPQAASAAPRRFHRHSRPASGSSSSIPAHEVVSYYAFSGFRKSPEALREFRQIVSIDGKKVKGDTSLEAFESGLARSDDRWRQKLLDDFEDAGEGGEVTDFGQILLLFTKASQHHYQFHIARHAELNNQPAIALVYEQASGNQSVHFISGPQTEDKQPLRGELWVRQQDHLPLKVSMTATHKEGGNAIRDEAEVAYAPLPDGALLPESVTHLRYVRDKLISRDTLSYSDWQRL
ncbi:MAG: hypothetical protein ACRD4P_16515, partial [Bryobacteraceae bacterium]